MPKSNKITIYQSLKHLWEHVAYKQRVKFYGILFLIIITSLTEVLSVGSVLPFLSVLTSPERVFYHHLAKPIIAVLGLKNPSQLLFPATIAFAFIALMSGVMRLLLLKSQTNLGYSIGADLSISIYRKTLYQPYYVHVSRNSSEVISGISNKVNNVISYTLVPVLTIVSSISILLAIMVGLFVIDPMVAFTAFLSFGVVYILVMLTTKKKLAKYSEEINHKSSLLIKILQEGLGGIRDVLIDSSQEVYCKVYETADLPLRKAQAGVTFISNSPRFIVESFGMVVIAFLALMQTKQTGGLIAVIPMLGLLVLGIQRLLPVFQQIYSNWAYLRSGQATLLETLKLLDQPISVHIYSSDVDQPLFFMKKLTFHNVSFKYSSGQPYTLKELNLTINKGSRVGIIGTTGSGKSTFLDIIMGLHEPTEGYMSVDGVNITQKNKISWQKHIAHVPQFIFLSDSTIAENIAFGVPLAEIDEVLVRKSAELAQLSDVIELWDLKYKTIVGERGVRLSGGQRQRIGIARALYKKADVIVFDEATSSLDTMTESSVMDAIRNINDDVTIIIVAHRLSTLSTCNQIVEINNGIIARVGPYSEIVDNKN